MEPVSLADFIRDSIFPSVADWRLVQAGMDTYRQLQTNIRKNQPPSSIGWQRNKTEEQIVFRYAVEGVTLIIERSDNPPTFYDEVDRDILDDSEDKLSIIVDTGKQQYIYPGTLREKVVDYFIEILHSRYR